MALPNQPVTLSIDQVAQLNEELRTLRHDINNRLAVVIAAVELIRLKPETAQSMIGTIAEQPAKITEALKHFTAEFEAALGIKRP